jgi:hypothetical protein
LKIAGERMDVVAACREVGSYRGAAALCGRTYKTVTSGVCVTSGRILASGCCRWPGRRGMRGRCVTSAVQLRRLRRSGGCCPVWSQQR